MFRLIDVPRLRDQNREVQVGILAEVLCELNVLHPFREGNGRTQRAFVAQLASAIGLELRWQFQEALNIEASKAAMRMDYGPMTKLIETSIVEADD